MRRAYAICNVVIVIVAEILDKIETNHRGEEQIALP